MEGITLFEKLRGRLFKAVADVNCNADEGDLKRNYMNYGIAAAYGGTLVELGHKLRIDCWDDKGFLRITEVAIGCETTEF